MKKPLTVLAVILGVVCIAIAVYYWMTPADMLPAFMPGYDAAMTGVHVKHGIAALVVGLALLIYAWFATGKKSSTTR
jgi:hypothetical protein